jgi:hypothetical protein
MIAVEFATYLVPTSPVPPGLVEGFIVMCVAFYKWGFGLLSHRFLHSLLQSYSLELHHPTPLGNLHMAAFVTLREANIGIEPPLNLWSHFSWAWLWHNSGVEAVSLGSGDISVCFCPRADSYFILQPDSLVEWQKA